MLDVWYSVLLDPTHVRVFKYNDVLCWSDNRGFGRVPAGVDTVQAGSTYRVEPNKVVLTSKNFDMSRLVETLANIEITARIKMDSDIEEAPTKTMDIKGELVECVQYHTKAKRHPILVNSKLHTILLSAVRRGADLYTTGDRLLVAAKIDGDIVAMAAAIKPKSEML